MSRKKRVRPTFLEPGDPRHGSPTGYNAGCHDACCRAAVAAYEKMRRSRISIYGKTGLMVPAIGTRRRIEGLMLLGWTAAEIGEAAGFHTLSSGTWDRNQVLRIRDSQQVLAKTAEAIAKAARALVVRTPPPRKLRTRQRRHGAAQGWVPIGAWDDIDDPDEQPQGIAGQCAEPGCPGKVKNRGRCERHYRAWLKEQEEAA